MPADYAMTIVEFLNRDRWRKFVWDHPNGSIFHTPEMFEVYSRTKDHEPLLLAALDGTGEIIALLVSVKIQTLPGVLGMVSSRSVFYAEPICSAGPAGAAALRQVIREHDRRMRNRVLFTEIRPLCQQELDLPVLQACGYKHAPYLNYLSDLQRSPEEMLLHMTTSGRRNVRKGLRQGLTVCDVTSAGGLEEIYPLLQETFARARVPLAPKGLFLNALNILLPLDAIRMFTACLDERSLAGSIILCHRDKVFYWYAGMTRMKSIYAMEVLVFEMLRWGNAHEYKTFDYGGAGWADEPYGVRDFKAKFGGKLVDYGRYRKVYSPLKFAVAEKAYAMSRSLWSIRHHLHSETAA
jgi:serine/alanine adding enzyme